MKKILEYYPLSQLAPTGGPCGYLYGLNQGLTNITSKDFEISFLPSNKNNNDFKKKTKASSNFFVRFLLKIYRRVKHVNNNLSIIRKKAKAPVNLNNYDYVHFHSAADIYSLRDELKEFKGKILFTSHSPQPLYQEYIESSSKFELFLFKKTYQKLKVIDEYAFLCSHIIIFPCEFSEEPYFNKWNDYRQIKSVKKNCYKYLLTGTSPAKVCHTKEEIRKKYKIPNDAFVVSYVGRHNEIKGYDVLKEIGLCLLEKNKNIYFLIAGNPGPIMPLNHPRWIEVGWTNEPHSITSASDIFLLPNKETYFDLVLLEVLSTGVPIVASKTGGNKFFSSCEGVFLFENNNQAVDSILRYMTLNKNERARINANNIDLYKEHFTTDAFAKNFYKLLKEIE